VGSTGGVYGIEVGVVVDMNVDWVDTENGAVLLVELFDFPEVLESVWEDVVVEFVPKC
jgi:hypothetical protein